MSNKKNIQNINFSIDLIIYPYLIEFSIGETNDKLKKELKKRLSPAAFQMAFQDDWLLTFQDGGGKCFLLGGHGQVIVRLSKNPTPGTVAHEIFHAVEMIMEFLKMPLCANNDEAYAYLIGYITEQYYKNTTNK